MRKTFAGLMMIGLCGPVLAQSSLTVYGVMDAALAHGSGSGVGSADRTSLISGGHQSSRIGFRGVEDLGGGVQASFNLEAQVFVDSGLGQATNTNNQASGGATLALNGPQGLTFARRSTVSLHSSRWGEFRLGRDFTAHYRNRLETDPFGNSGVGTIQPFVGSIGGPVSTRASNIVGYFLPGGLGGLYGQLQYYAGENASNSPQSDDGTGQSGRIGYQWGSFNVSFAAARTQYARTATSGDISARNIGLHYKVGPVRLMAGYFRDVVDRTVPLKGRGWTAGGIWANGAGEYKFAVSQYGTNATGEPATRKLSLGYVHNLSKRTALYSTYARVWNEGGAAAALNGSVTAPNQRSSGIDIGVRHAF